MPSLFTALRGPLCLAIWANLAADPATITPQMLPLSYVHDMVWNDARARLFLSTGSAVVIVNPETAQIEDTIESGDVAGRIAVSGDGQYLYAAVGARGIIERFNVDSHKQDLTITLGTDNQGHNLTAASMIVLPGLQDSILVAVGAWPALDDDYYAIQSQSVVIYDKTAQRTVSAPVNVSSLYIRRSGGSIYGWGSGGVYRFAINDSGVAVDRSTPIPTGFSANSLPTWNGGLLLDRTGIIFDLESGTLLGRAAITSGCALTPASTGDSILAAQTDASGSNNAPASLMQYSLTNFLAFASVPVVGSPDFAGACDSVSTIAAWGTDGIAIASFQHGGGGSNLVMLHASGLIPIAPAPLPVPKTDGSGVIHLPLTVNDLVFDPTRNLLWATVPGSAQPGNSVVSIDAASGRIVDVIAAGSEPGMAALSNDGSRLFMISQTVGMIGAVDLNAKQMVQSFSVSDSILWSPVGLVTLPDQNNTVVVVRIPAGTSYASAVTVYDGGAPRPRSATNFDPKSSFGIHDIPFVTSIFPGDTSTSLYGADLQLQYGGGTHDVARLTIDQNGVSLDRILPPLQLGDTSYFGVQTENLVYESGRLFTSGGELRSPDTTVLQGTFSIQQSYPFAGIPVPFGDGNQVAYVYHSGLTSASSVTLFDVATQRPKATMPLPSIARVAVRAGAGTLAISSGGEIMLIPLASLTPWPQYSGVLHRVAAGVQSLDINVNAISALPGTSKLLLALPGNAGNIGNSIAVLNTDSGQIEESAFIGSEPQFLRAAADGSKAYAYLSGEYRVGRFDVASGSRDLVFVPDPAGGSAQYPLADMALGPDGGLTASLFGGWLATFDNGVVRPNVDKNDQGPGAFSGAPYTIALNDSGTKVYAFDGYWSTSDFERDALTPDGLHWLSGTTGLIFGAEIKSARGLLYSSNGAVIDPERSRRVGAFPVSAHVAPDPAAGRVYFTSGSQIVIFDSQTYAMLASWAIPNNYQTAALDLVRFGSDGLAFHTNDGRLFLVSISAIPLLATPVPSPQPTLPLTPGVAVVDLATNDLAYDASRDLIYGTVPNSEAAQGDHIVAIDPGSAAITNSWSTAHNPSLLAISDDRNQLYFSSGGEDLAFFSGFSPASDAIRDIDLTSGTIGSGFPIFDTSSDFSYHFVDLAVLRGQPQSIAAIDSLTESAGGGVATSPGALSIYDSGVPRTNFLRPHTFSCGYVVPAESASQLYCSSGIVISRLGADSDGVKLLGSIPLLPGRGAFGHMVFRDGKIYTTTGVIVDTQAGRVITRLDTQGPVAIDGNLIYWLDPSTSTQSSPNVTLRAFDVSTLQPVGARPINVTSTDVTRLIACGHGRVAFRAGHEIYIVNP
jgi:hypothetical protein